MAEPSRRSELDALLVQARAARPPEISELEARRLVRTASEGASLRGRKAVRAIWLGIAAACAAALLVLLRPPSASVIELSPEAVPLRLSLESGDTLLIAPGARLTVRDDGPRLRSLELERGGVLFDVAPLGERSAFEVHTRHAVVRVVGTVFSVAVEGSRTLVHVHEGRVSVGGRTLGVGERWASSGALPEGPARFAFEASTLAEARTEAARTEAARADLAKAAKAVSSPSATPLPPSTQAPAFVEVPPSTAAQQAGPNLPRTEVRAAEGLAESAHDARSSDGDWLSAGRAHLRAGEAERALTISHARRGDPQFLLLDADALRALGRFEEAAASYDLLAEHTAGTLRTQAGYAAAQLALSELHSPERALATLDRFALDDSASPLAERATVLRIDALLALARRREAVAIARRYLAGQPETLTSERLRALAAGAR